MKIPPVASTPLNISVPLLMALYFSQGLPAGILVHALPVLLREHGASLTLIAGSSILALPWALKFLWAPLLDSHSGRKSRHKRWLLPLQLCSILVLFIFSFVSLDHWLGPFFIAFILGLFLLNLLSATMDIAADSLTVLLLSKEQRGFGNTIQVGAAKIGLILGGSGLLLSLDVLGWPVSIAIMACLLLIVFIVSWQFNEDAWLPITAGELAASSVTDRQGLLNSYWQAFKGLFDTQGFRAWLCVLVLYKFGDSLSSAIFKPMLVDAGVSKSDIGWIVAAAAVCGIVGAVMAGAMLAHRTRLFMAVVAGLAQAIGLCLFAVLSVFTTEHLALWVACFEQFADGASTVVLFTLMMDRCRRSHAGGDYTLQASLFVMVTGIARLSSGLLADNVGYTAHFIICTIFALLAVFLLFVLAKHIVLIPVEQKV